MAVVAGTEYVEPPEKFLSAAHICPVLSVKAGPPALIRTGVNDPAGFTVTTTSSVPVSAESLTVSRKVYVPAVVNVAVVANAVGAENVTPGGPATTDHAYV